MSHLDICNTSYGRTGTVSGLLLGSPRTKSHSDVGAMRNCRKYYMGEGGGSPSPGYGESSEYVLPVACPNTKSDFECNLTNLLVSFDAGPSN
jgi:hypothetical protein